MRLVYNIFCKFNDIEILRYLLASIKEKMPYWSVVISNTDFFEYLLYKKCLNTNNPISVLLSIIYIVRLLTKYF